MYHFGKLGRSASAAAQHEAPQAVRLYRDPREHSPQMTRASGSCAFPATGTNPISLLTHSTALQKEGPAGREGPEAGPEPSCGDQRSRSRATCEARTHGPGRGARRCGKARPGGRGVRRGRGQEPHRRSPEAGAVADPQLLGRMLFRVTSERSSERRWPGGAKS